MITSTRHQSAICLSFVTPTVSISYTGRSMERIPDKVRLPKTTVLRAFCTLMADLQYLYCAWTMKYHALNASDWQTLLGNFIGVQPAKLVFNNSSAIWAVRPAKEKAAFMKASDEAKVTMFVEMAEQTAAEPDADIRSLKRKVEKYLAKTQHSTVSAFLSKMLSAPETISAVRASLPMLSFPNTWLKITKDPSLEADFEDFIDKACSLKEALQSRSTEEARKALEVAYGSTVRKHVIVGLTYSTSMRIGATSIHKLSPEKTSLVILKWSQCEKELVDLEADDLFDAEDEELFERERARPREMKGRYTAGPQRRRRLTKRGFLSRAATRATRRLVGSFRKWSDEGNNLRRQIFRLLVPMLVGTRCCYICSVRLTFEAHTRRDLKKSKGNRDMIPSNFSPDAKVSGKRGGDYSKGNTGKACMLGREDMKYIKFWCDKQHKELTRKHRKQCLLKAEDIEEIVKCAYAGDGCVREASGVPLPLPCLSVDRIDPSRSYTASNCRLLETGENFLRNSDKTDQRIVQWRTYVNENLSSIAVTAELPGASAFRQFLQRCHFQFDSEHSNEYESDGAESDEGDSDEEEDDWWEEEADEDEEDSDQINGDDDR
ncbi:unnamed protein product [Sympodiomycopsis kandeliae]